MNVDNYVVDPALQALQSGQEIPWQEVIDPNSYQVYYYNKVTGVTQWERPEELGAAPMATGWFGRGQAGAAALYSQMNDVYLSRPARQQKDFIDPKKYHTEGAQEYNIWYGRFIGDISDKMDREPATDRCVLQTDAGYTKADQSNQDGDRKNKRHFCLHFARGMCAKGSECTYYHRIPTPQDDARTDELVDCFGRQRHAKHKDDMSGVGTFSKPCRTLFVGNLNKSSYATPKDLEDALWRHFGEWGELESLNVIHRLSIAFPRYRLRTSAEFAKEAMMCQALDHQEVLSIRWAHDDPNPVAKDSIQRADKDALVALMRAKGISLTPAGFDYPPNYALPEAKRMRLDEGGALLEEHPELAYPDTAMQYAQALEAAQQSEDNTGAAAQLAREQALRNLGLFDDQPGKPSGDKKDEQQSMKEITEEDAQKQTAEGRVEAEEDHGEEEEEEGEGGWQQFSDEATGAIYYFNTSTGESSWTPPEGFEGSTEASATQEKETAER